MRVRGTLAALLAAFAVLITACGDGDSGGGGVTASQQPVTVATAALAAATQGQAYTELITASGGTNAGFNWSIIAGALPAGLILSPTGTPMATLAGTPSVDGTFDFTVRVTDSAGASGTAALQLDVASAPPLVIATATLLPGQQGQPYNATIAASGGSGAGYTWSVTLGALPNGLSMPSAGTPSTTLAGTPTVTGTFNFTVQVTDSIGLAAMQALQLNLAPAPALAITTITLAQAQQGQAYNAVVDATGGSGAGYTWSIIAGALPAGITLGANGTPSTALAGLPSAAGAFNFTVQVQDSIGLTATVPLLLTVAPATPLAVTTTLLPGGTLNQPYMTMIDATGGSAAGYTWSIVGGTLPAGVGLGTTGTPSTSLGGTPTVFGTFNLTVRVEDSIGLSDTQALQLVIASGAPLIITSTPTPPDATLAVAYAHQVVATGGSSAGYQWSAIQGALPPGLVLGAAGTPAVNLAGIATAFGRFEFTVQVTDSQAATATLAITLIVVTGSGTDTWSNDFTVPFDRAGRAVFTGSRIIQWGGFALNGQFFTSNVTNEGEVFMPQTGQSTAITFAGAPSARAEHTAVWTGSRMLVFGGRDDLMTPAGDLYSYDPGSNTWAAITAPGAPSARFAHSAVWTGTEMIIWGGLGAAGTVSSGGAYNPSSNQWRNLPAPPAAVNSRAGHKAVWTGTQMMIWGGFNQPAAMPPTQILYDGAVYDLAGNNWPLTIPIAQAPLLDTADCTMVWTGTRLLLWGYNDGTSTQMGATWNPAGGWTPMATANQPTARRGQSATLVGDKLVVWGGLDTPGSNVAVNDGGVYQLSTNSWGPMSLINAPSGRFNHYAFWTGREIIIWGGRDMGFSGSNPYANGAIYTP